MVEGVVNSTPPYSSSQIPIIHGYDVIVPTSVPVTRVSPYTKDNFDPDVNRTTPTSIPLITNNNTKKTIVIFTNIESNSRTALASAANGSNVLTSNYADFVLPYGVASKKFKDMPKFKDVKNLGLTIKNDWSNYTKDSKYTLDLASIKNGEVVKFESWSDWKNFNKDIATAIRQPFSDKLTNTGLLQLYYLCNVNFVREGITTKEDVKKIFGTTRENIALQTQFINSRDLICGYKQGSTRETTDEIDKYMNKMKDSLDDSYNIEIISNDGKDIFEIAEYVKLASPDLCIVISEKLTGNAKICYPSEKSYSSMHDDTDKSEAIAETLASALSTQAKRGRIGALEVIEDTPSICIDYTAVTSDTLCEKLKQGF